MMRSVILLLLLSLAGPILADANEDLAALEKVYRDLLQAIADKDYDAILKTVHKDGLGGADAMMSREQILKELKDPGSFLRKALYAREDDVAAELCREQGRSPLSPAAFYKKFKDKFDISSQVLKAGSFWSIGATARADQGGASCQYFLHALTFMKEKDGKFYLVSNFR